MGKKITWTQEESDYLLEIIEKNNHLLLNKIDLVNIFIKKFGEIKKIEQIRDKINKIVETKKLKIENKLNDYDKDVILNDYELLMTNELKKEHINKKYYCNIVEFKKHVDDNYTEFDIIKNRVDNKIRTINAKKLDDDIKSDIKEEMFICNECKLETFGCKKLWKGNEICDVCHYDEKKVRKRVKKITKVKKYMKKKNICCCVFCNKKYNFNVADYDTSFNFDHLNMFDKTLNIGGAVISGMKKRDIIKELDKCQLVCVTCHKFITKYECRLGFTSIKTFIEKKIDDDKVKDELLTKYKAKYNEEMSKIYTMLRSNLNKSND